MDKDVNLDAKLPQQNFPIQQRVTHMAGHVTLASLCGSFHI